MTSPITPQRAAMLLMITTGLGLSACATKSDRRGPPKDGERQERPARTSGTFLQPAAVLFAGMDTNGDKAISRAEVNAGVTSEWASFGRNPSATQFAQWSIHTLGSTDANPTFMSFDRDFNGVITEGEFSTQIETLFERFDKNKDGSIERAEMIVAFAAPVGRSQGGERGQQGRGQGRGQGGGGRPPR